MIIRMIQCVRVFVMMVGHKSETQESGGVVETGEQETSVGYEVERFS